MLSLADLEPLLQGLLPSLGASGSIVVVAGFGWLLVRKNRFQEDKDLAKDRRDSMEELREERDGEREMRREEEKLRRDCERRVDRFLDELRCWSGIAHDMRHARLNDRQMHIAHEIKHGIEPLMLPDVAMVPKLTEAEE